MFHWVLTLLDTAALGKVIMLTKINLLDGFWLMIVQEDQQHNFVYAMLDPLWVHRFIV